MLSLTLALGLVLGDLQVDQPTLDRLVAEILPAVQADQDVRFPGGLTVRPGTTAEVLEILVEENVTLLLSQLGNEEDAREAARTFAEGLAPSMMAKYCFGRAEILVSGDAIHRLSKLVGVPELATEEALRGVLVHEIVHAVDDQRYGLMDVLVGLESAEQIQAYNAVMEGHAQQVARRICAAQGWSAGFDVFANAIGLPPAGADEGEAMALLYRIQAQTFEAWYHGGERFFDSVVAAEGDAGVRRAFLEPPQDLDAVLQPGWFLDPSTRPRLAFDLDRGLDLFGEAYEGDEWLGQRITVNRSQLRAAFSLLEEEVIERVLAPLRSARLQNFTPSESPGSQVIAMVLYEFPSAADAAAFVLAERELLVRKDETMKEGPIRIEGAAYEDLEGGGFLATKTIKAYGEEVPAMTIVAVEGPLALELMYSNRPTEPEEALAAARSALAAARSLAEPVPGEPTGEGAEKGAGEPDPVEEG